jgi:hypothetical protein
MYVATTTAGQIVNVHQATAPWGETTVAWNGFGASYRSPPVATFDAGPSNPLLNIFRGGAPNAVGFQIPQLVQDWLNGVTPNDGLLLEQPDAAGVWATALSSEFPPANSAYHPSLEVCFAVTCAAGTADCNHKGIDGCETDLTTLQNCGACGNVCPAASGPCTAPACDPVSGCVQVPVADGSSCATGNACSPTGTCHAGACVAAALHDGQACTTGADCVSGTCTGGFCQAPTSGALTVAAGSTTSFESLTNIGTVSAISGATVTTTNAGGFHPGDQALLINMQGTRADFASAGNYELLEVECVAGSTVTLGPAPAKAYGNGGSNASLAGQKVFLVRVPTYSSVTIDGTLTAGAWNGTNALGVVALRSTGPVTVGPGGAVDVSARGYWSPGTSCNGVSGLPGESYLPVPPQSVQNCVNWDTPNDQPNGGGGGGALSNCNFYACSTQLLGASGGGASYGTAGAAGANNGSLQVGGLPGLVYGQPALTQIFLGSGGGQGAGGTNGPNDRVLGGRGGGLVYISAPTLTVDGAVRADGQVGGNNLNCSPGSSGSGSSGGGSGGSIYLRAATVSLGTVTAHGGPGGCAGGGTGGDGRIRIDYDTLNGAAFPSGLASLTGPAAYLGQGPALCSIAGAALHDGQACTTGADCVSGTCTGGVCQAPTSGALTVAAGSTTSFESLTNIGTVSAISGATVTTTNAGGFHPGDQVLLINMQGTRADFASAGNYELLEVECVAGGTVTLGPAPAKAYGNGGSNASLAGQKVFLVRVPTYSSVTIDGTLTAGAWNGTNALGLVALRSTGAVTVGGAVDVSARGYWSASTSCNGVSGLPGESYLPVPPQSVQSCVNWDTPNDQPNGGGGGGALSNCNFYACSTQLLGASGGGASYGTAGTAGANNGTLQIGGLPGLVYGQPALTQLFLGSGGGQGAGGTNGPGDSVQGGRGGGLVYISAPTLTVSGAVRADGQVGGNNLNCPLGSWGSGSSGGGSGGSIYLRAAAVSLGTVTAHGGPGGCQGGGTGGVGRIRIDYDTLDGAAFPSGLASLTSPAAYLAQGPAQCSGQPDGTPCDDGNPCTTGDACHGGACAGAPVVCTASDTCHTAGVCNPATGTCSNPTVANGTACNDGSACTTGDSCQNGVCTGVPVTCTASDQCHTAGACDPATGICSNPAAANGTACNDGNACTTGDSCQNGVCAGVPVTCTASDSCHTAGACDPATGTCSNPTAANGTACNDGNACTTGDSCQNGVCAGVPVTCTASDPCHTAGVCNPATGTCSNPAVANGTACNDGNACTTGDSCQNGVCTGVAVTCTASDPCHTAGACDPATGTCSNPAAANGTACNDGNACTTGDACQNGVCAGTPVTCTPSDACHAAGVCDPATGVCSNPSLPDGTACDDGNACTASDVCQAGVCAGVGAPPTIATPSKKTNDTMPDLTGSACPSGLVDVYFDGVLIGTATAGASGSWAYAPTMSLPDGVYVVTARVDGSQPSSAITITIDTMVHPPSNLVADAVGGQVFLTWDASPDGDVIGYEVYRKITGHPDQEYTKLHQGVVTDTQFCDGAVVAGVNYSYRVRAVDDTLQEAP